MKIMGIDFDTKQFAYGILDNGKYIRSKTVVYTSPKILQGTLFYILQLEKPDLIGIEQVYMSKNSATALQLAEVLGMIKIIISTHELDIGYTIVNSRAAKAAVGAKAKDEVIKKVIGILNIPENVKLDSHQSDAISIAYYLHKERKK